MAPRSPQRWPSQAPRVKRRERQKWAKEFRGDLLPGKGGQELARKVGYRSEQGREMGTLGQEEQWGMAR